MSAPVMLEVANLTREFGGLVAVSNVSFAVNEGEIVGLIGPNGAGKTTVFNMVAGSMPPTSGIIRFRDNDITPLEAHDRALLGISRTFQITSVFPALTARENVRTATYRNFQSGWGGALMRSVGWRRDEAAIDRLADEALSFCELLKQADVRAAALSYGEQRRLELAIALATQPALLLLDEPAAGLNPEEGQKLVAMIKQVRDRGVTVLLFEHHMRVVMGVCDRIVVLDHGARIAEGAPRDVAENPDVIRVYLGREKAHA